MGKIPEKENPADLLTKYLPGVKVAEISRSPGFFFEGGRSDIADSAYVGAVSAMGRWSRGGVSAALTVIARKLTASRAGEGKPTLTSDDACSKSQDCQGNHERCRAKVRETLSSAQRTTTSTGLHISATRTGDKFHAYRNFLIP